MDIRRLAELHLIVKLKLLRRVNRRDSAATSQSGGDAVATQLFAMVTAP